MRIVWWVMVGCLFVARKTGTIAATATAIATTCEMEQQQQDRLSKAIVSDRDLSLARLVAHESLLLGCNEDKLAKLYQQEADRLLLLPHNNDDYPIDLLLVVEPTERVQSRVDQPNCWNFHTDQGDSELELWDHCCSMLNVDPPLTASITFAMIESSFGHSDKDDPRCYRGSRPMCCEFYPGSSSYLRLPALRELSLRVRVKDDDDDDDDNATTTTTTTITFDVEQDGFLRRFDPGGILWPTGYLLSQCVSAPRLCGVPELYTAIASTPIGGTAAVELGAGIGLPSIVLAKTIDRMEKKKTKTKKYGFSKVIATDIAKHALALTHSNAQAANVSVVTKLLDHSDRTALTQFRAHELSTGCSIILASALQALFDETTKKEDHHLWKTLDVLLDHTNTSIVLLAHTINSLQIPQHGMFRRIRNISGDHFGMKTRWGDTSDFEISVLQRRQTRIGPKLQNEEL